MFMEDWWLKDIDILKSPHQYGWSLTKLLDVGSRESLSVLSECALLTWGWSCQGPMPKTHRNGKTSPRSDSDLTKPSSWSEAQRDGQVSLWFVCECWRCVEAQCLWTIDQGMQKFAASSSFSRMFTAHLQRPPPERRPPPSVLYLKALRFLVAEGSRGALSEQVQSTWCRLFWSCGHAPLLSTFLWRP